MKGNAQKKNQHQRSLLQILKALYKNLKTAALWDNEMEDFFHMAKGFRQGGYTGQKHRYDWRKTWFTKRWVAWNVHTLHKTQT